MHQDPSPTPERATSSTFVRIVLAAILAGAGVVVLLVGLGSLGPRGSNRSPDASAGANVGTARPVLPTGSGTEPPQPSQPVLPSASGDPVLVGAGDIATCGEDADEATAALVEQTPGIVFTLGDNAYENGTAAEFRDCFGPSWGRFFDRIALPVPGNHDYNTDGASGYREYFGARAVRDGATWYSTDVGTWHVVVLDSDCDKIDGGCGPDSPQVRWLRDDLAQHPARCTLALFHHPRFSSGYHGSDDAVAPFWDALYAGGADLVLNGHEHDYERFGPQDPQGQADPDRGITELIVGTGGASLRDFRDPIPNGRVRSSLAHGVVSLTLGRSGWAFRFASVDGSFTDEGTGACH